MFPLIPLGKRPIKNRPGGYGRRLYERALVRDPSGSMTFPPLVRKGSAERVGVFSRSSFKYLELEAKEIALKGRKLAQRVFWGGSRGRSIMNDNILYHA